MNNTIASALRRVASDYENDRLTNGQLKARLSDIVASIRVDQLVNPQPRTCPVCGEPEYRHHIC